MWRMPYPNKIKPRKTHENTITTDTGLLSDAEKRRRNPPTAIDATPMLFRNVPQLRPLIVHQIAHFPSPSLLQHTLVHGSLRLRIA
jgi:hypothetical protein